MYQDLDHFKANGRLSPDAEKRVADNKGLDPEDAKYSISYIIEGLPKDEHLDRRTKRTEAYFRKLTRIGDTGLLNGQVTDEFLRHSAELTQETIDVFYQHRLLPGQVNELVITTNSELSALSPQERTEISDEIKKRTGNENNSEYILAFFGRFIRQKGQKGTLHDQYTLQFIEDPDGFVRSMQKLTNNIGKLPPYETGKIEQSIVEQVQQLDTDKKGTLKGKLSKLHDQARKDAGHTDTKPKTINRLIKNCLQRAFSDVE